MIRSVGLLTLWFGAGSASVGFAAWCLGQVFRAAPGSDPFRDQGRRGNEDELSR